MQTHKSRLPGHDDIADVNLICNLVSKGGAMEHPKLLSPPTNYAVIQLPGRAFPGVVFQGDSLRSMLVDLRVAVADVDPDQRAFILRDMVECLEGVQNNYERVLAKEGIPLPYEPVAGKAAPVAQLVASNVIYHSQNDERAFFEWLERMPFVQDYYGVVRDLFIDLKRLPTDLDLWEIIGFFRRYAIDLKQLEQFATGVNREWLANALA